MRVAWLCTFWNEHKRRHVARWRECARKEIGQWIPNLLTAFQGNVNYEIHVITVDIWMKKLYQTWREGNIVYHCFQPLLPFVGSCPGIQIDAMTSFVWNRLRIASLLKRIRPDIVHLFGAENPQYAAAVLNLPRSVPVVCTIQGFVTRELAHNNIYVNRVRSKFEKRILGRINWFLGDCDSEFVVKRINPAAVYDYFYFPVDEKLVDRTPRKQPKYDILFAGAQTKAKGFGDFLEIVAHCVGKKPGFKAAVVGTVDAFPGTREFVAKNRLENAIIFTGRFPTQEGLFVAYRQAKAFLAPTYNDAFASTIRENMLLGTPCIAYRTGGIPYANDDGNENVVIVEQGDWRAMAEKALFYSEDEGARLKLAARAKAYAERVFSLKANVDVIKRMYERVLLEWTTEHAEAH